MSDYYVYQYTNPTNNTPFYVGYGKNNRLNDHLREAIKNPKPVQGEHRLNTIRKILREGGEPLISIIKDNLTLKEAHELEKELITSIGRADLGNGPLTNKADGGEGVSNPSLENRRERSKRQKNKTVVVNLITGKTEINVSLDDPRWKTGEIAGINHGKSLYTNGTVHEVLSTNHPLVLSGDFKRPNENKCVVVIDGKNKLVSVEEKNKNGYVSANKNKVPVVGLDGEKILVDKSHPDYISGKLKSIVGSKVVLRHELTGMVLTIERGNPIPDGYVGQNKGGHANLVTLADTNLVKYRVSKDDPRIGVTLFPFKKNRDGSVKSIVTQYRNADH